jgi:hypothetical protein
VQEQIITTTVPAERPAPQPRQGKGRVIKIFNLNPEITDEQLYVIRLKKQSKI